MKKKIMTILLGTVLACSICADGCGSSKDASQTPDVQEDSDAGEEQETSVEADTQKISDAADDLKPSDALDDSKSGFSNLNTFTANTLDGGTFTQEDFADKDVTVINFWALFCGPCIAEMPDIAAFAKTLPDNVQLLTACLDGQEAQEDVKNVLEQAGYEGVTLLNGDGDYQKLFGEIMYIPTTLILDKDGNIIGDAIVGGQEDLAGTFMEAINQALKSMGKTEITNAE